MDGFAWVIVAVFIAGMIVLLGLTFSPFYARYSAYRHSVLIRVDLPRRLDGAVSARLMARDRGAGIGALIFTLAAALTVQSNVAPLGGPELMFWFIGGAAIAGTGVGTAVAALARSPQVAPDQPRISRSIAVTVADYVHPLERIGAWVIVALSVGAVIVGAALTAGGTNDIVFPIAVLFVLGVGSLAGFHFVGRRIVDQSRPAGSTAELVWDDAIRSLLLRDLLAAPVALGAFALVVGAMALIANSVDPAVSSEVSGIVPTFLMLAIVLYNRSSRPQRYFVDRLWPNLRWSDTADVAKEAA